MAWLLLSGCVLLLALQLLVARRLPVIARLIIAVQVIYWLLAYVFRSATLLIFDPQPRAGDNIADARLHVIGYSESLVPVLVVVDAGLLCYLICLLAWRQKTTVEQSPREARPVTGAAEPFLVIWVVGWVARLATQSDAGAAGLFSAVALLATLGASGVLVFSGTSRWRGNPVWCLPIIAGEFYWSIATASKTPIIAAGVAVVIHYALTGWSKRATRVALLGAIAVVLSFSAFQSFKLGADATREFETSIEANYAPHLRPLLELERRFDQLSAVTDATFVNPSRSWLSPTEAVTRAFKSALPTVIVGEKTNSGKLWNLEVRSKSVPYASLSDVSLADGFIAEGYAIAGLAGVAIEAAIMAVAVGMVARSLYSRRSIGVYWALLMLTFPVLQERGAFGTIELASKTLQVAAAASLIAIAHRAITRRNRHASPESVMPMPSAVPPPPNAFSRE